jgi:hypothetical protein
LAAILYGSAQSGLAAARQALIAALVHRRQRTRLRAFPSGHRQRRTCHRRVLWVGWLFIWVPASLLDGLRVGRGLLPRAATVLDPASRRGTVAAVKGERRLAVLRDRPYAWSPRSTR